jgi:hypothetical protein
MAKVFIGHVFNNGEIVDGIVNPFHFPDYINYGDSDDLLNEESNLILYNTNTKKSIHIAYIKIASTIPVNYTSQGLQLYEAYVRSDDGVFDLMDFDEGVPPDGSGSPYELRRPLKTLSGDTRFSTNSIMAKNGIDLGFLTRFIDLKSDAVTPTDFDRYVSDEKIHFRIRVSRSRQYPVSYTDEDNGKMPYVGPDIDTKGDYVATPGAVDGVNFPWTNSDGTSRDESFDWKKIEILETVRKFGLNYFKCASK